MEGHFLACGNGRKRRKWPHSGWYFNCAASHSPRKIFMVQPAAAVVAGSIAAGVASEAVALKGDLSELAL